MVRLCETEISFHYVVDLASARCGRKLRTREYCWLLGELETWAKEHPGLAQNQDALVLAAVRLLREL